jgi:hypothetical protein
MRKLHIRGGFRAAWTVEADRGHPISDMASGWASGWRRAEPIEISGQTAT